ncbi:MAG TPA: isoaspartyl peptidase/L-asparaginase [Candidatus Dormibacteraeota bacterium]
MPVALAVHGGAGSPPEREYAERQAAVEGALAAGWERIEEGALAAVMAAVRFMEDEPVLNAAVGAVLNREGEVELDAAVMDGSTLRAGAVGAVREARHPVDLARAVMEDGRHVLLVGSGADRFAHQAGVETCLHSVFVTDRQRRNWNERFGADTVGAVAVDAEGRTAVAASTGGVTGKLPGRVGDTPMIGAGFYADDAAGAACGTGQGEGFMRTLLCYRAVAEMLPGLSAQTAAEAAVSYLSDRVKGLGGIILVTPAGEVAAAWNTDFMSWASRTG